MSHIRSKAQSDDSVKLCEYYEAFDTDGRDSSLPVGIYDLGKLRGLSDDFPQ